MQQKYKLPAIVVGGVVEYELPEVDLLRPPMGGVPMEN